MTSIDKGLVGYTGDPLAGFVQASDRRQNITRVVINQNTDVNGGSITQFGLFQINMPLLIGLFLFITPITNSIRLAFEGIAFDRQASTVQKASI